MDRVSAPWLLHSYHPAFTAPPVPLLCFLPWGTWCSLTHRWSIAFSTVLSSPLCDPSKKCGVNSKDRSHLGEGRNFPPFLRRGSQGTHRLPGQQGVLGWVGGSCPSSGYSQGCGQLVFASSNSLLQVILTTAFTFVLGL